MALNNNKELYVKKTKQFLLYGFVLFLLIFNIFVFCRYISSNPEYTINYQTPTDEMKEFRNPLMGMFFTDNQNKIKLVVLPDMINQHRSIRYPKMLNIDNQPTVVIKNEKTTEKHLQYLQRKMSNISMISDIEKIYNDAIIVWFDNVENPLEDFEKIKNYAKTHKLYPKTFDMINYKKINSDTVKKKAYTLDEQQKNLSSFVNNYRPALSAFIKNYSSLKGYDKRLNDKASSVVVVCDDNKICEEFTDLSFDKSVLKSISENLHQANKKYPDNNKKIFLLTKLEKHNFNSEKEFFEELNNSFGVIMEKGLLSGMMMPSYWDFYPDKKEFIKNLKIKSGINPDYWSNDIQIYFFKAVEI